MRPAPVHTSWLSSAHRISLLRSLWLLTVLWCELGVFFRSSLSCTWPDPAPHSHVSPKHVLIVADPQVLDAHSYPGRNPLLTALSQHIVDLNLRKSWRVAKSTRPDAVIFLGDMMDNGRSPSSAKESVLRPIMLCSHYFPARRPHSVNSLLAPSY
ncbi:hypothetical protein EW146_g10400 [Bondarzewia mesenterica]|uniref:Calcineurin-like phosphoesterase domain-containing protein n=1 Tax=Bondarzewia mesenterica TaxID=1095465 RepID=A0A4S4KXK1_9AGAM|nr:hypothetical protein EW146_g10400 [Bondarzewia mesenterica]